MTFTNIRMELAKEYNAYKLSHGKAIKSCDSTLNHYLTKTRCEQLQKGLITKPQAEKFAIDRMIKQLDKRYVEEIATLEQAEESSDLESVSIFVTWHKSKIWGMNPTAECRIFTKDGQTIMTTGTASGCGYDKESAAIADGLNDIPAIRKMLCKIKETAMINGRSSDTNGSRSNADCIEYGAGYGAIPYLEGGVGSSCFVRIFEKAGFVVEHNSYKSGDYYNFSKR